MARYSPITSRERAPELAAWPRVLVAIAAALAGWLGGLLAWNAVREHLAWRAFRQAPTLEVTLIGTEGEIERAITDSMIERIPIELAYREEPVGAELRGRFHRFAGAAWSRSSSLSAADRSRRTAWIGSDPDQAAWLRDLRARGPLAVSRIGVDLVSRVDRPDARGEATGIGLFCAPLLAMALTLAVVAITGNPVRSRRSPAAFLYAFHAVCLLPLTFLAVSSLGLAAPLAKVFGLANEGLVPEWIALGVYGVVLVLLVPWIGFFMRITQWVKSGSDAQGSPADA